MNLRSICNYSGALIAISVAAATLLAGNARAQEQSLEERVKKLEVENEMLKKMLGVPAKPGEPAKGTPAKAGLGNITIDGMVQMWFMHDPAGAYGAKPTGEDTFRLRRGEFKVSGDILPEIGFNIMFDLSKVVNSSTVKEVRNSSGALTGISVDAGKGNILQDCWVQWRLSKMFPQIESWAPKLEVIFGQLRPPISEEGGLRPSSSLDVVDYSMFTRSFGFANRDIGLMFKDSYKYVDYYAGVFNGSGANTVDLDSEKIVAGHLIGKPIKGLKLGVSGQTGITGTGANEGVQNRLGFDAQYEYDLFSVKAEWMHGRDGVLSREGFFVQPGFYLIKDKLQLVGRYDWFDPSQSKGGDIVKEMSACLNWFIFKHNAKLQFQFTRRNDKAATNENLILINLQTAF